MSHAEYLNLTGSAHNVRAFLVAIVLALLFLAGCGGVGGRSTTNSSGGGTSSPPEYLFASHGLDDSISVFRVDMASGALAEISGSPFASTQSTTAHTVCIGSLCDAIPRPLAVAPSGQFVYLVNPDISGLMAYRIDSTSGALTSISSLAYDIGNGPVSIAITPDSTYLYVDSEFPPEITSFIIDQQSGTLRSVTGSPFSVSELPNSMSASSSNLFIGSTDSPGGILSFDIDTGTGVLTAVAGSPFASGQAITTLTLDASGQYLLAASNTDNSLRSYRVSNGVLSEVSSVPVGANPQLVVAVRGGYVYLATNSALYGYSLVASTGALNPIQGFPVNMQLGGMAVDPSAKFLFVVDESNNSIATFGIDAKTGSLTRTFATAPGAAIYSNLAIATP